MDKEALKLLLAEIAENPHNFDHLVIKQAARDSLSLIVELDNENEIFRNIPGYEFVSRKNNMPFA